MKTLGSTINIGKGIFNGGSVGKVHVFVNCVTANSTLLKTAMTNVIVFIIEYSSVGSDPKNNL